MRDGLLFEVSLEIRSGKRRHNRNEYSSKPKRTKTSAEPSAKESRSELDESDASTLVLPGRGIWRAIGAPQLSVGSTRLNHPTPTARWHFGFSRGFEQNVPDLRYYLCSVEKPTIWCI